MQVYANKAKNLEPYVCWDHRNDDSSKCAAYPRG